MQAIEEQVYTIERALGERMVKHALFVVRLWLNELGEDNSFEDAYRSLFARYDDFFADWVVAGDGEQDEVLETMTSDAYRLVDAVYAELRIKRGMSPKMHGFNGENPQSVMHYFSSCVQFKDYDMDWLRSVLNDTNRSSIALMTVAALAKNLRECFSETAMMALVDGIHASNSLVAEQCMANVLLLLAHYDVRIDFFRELQEAFVEAIGDGELAFETLCALIKSVKVNLSEMIASGEFSMDNLPEELQNLLGESGIQDNYQETEVLMPASEKEYMAGLVQMLPDTWVYITLVGENEERKRKMRLLYLSVGNMNMMWDKTEAAEQMLVRKLRTKGGDAKDYINYGHCLLLKGDRLMAFENYREARRLCKSAKEFYAIFRPDRRQLVDRGIPVEQVYLIEDQLFSI